LIRKGMVFIRDEAKHLMQEFLSGLWKFELCEHIVVFNSTIRYLELFRM